MEREDLLQINGVCSDQKKPTVKKTSDYEENWVIVNLLIIRHYQGFITTLKCNDIVVLLNHVLFRNAY